VLDHRKQLGSRKQTQSTAQLKLADAKDGDTLARMCSFTHFAAFDLLWCDGQDLRF
jgi:hypothetical protein